MRSSIALVMLAALTTPAGAAPAGKLWRGCGGVCVHARVAGRESVMLLDTGSPVHIWSLVAARAAGAALRGRGSYVDVDGRAHDSFAVTASAEIVETPLPPAPLAASSFVDDLQPHGRNQPRFEGLLSPQQLPSPGRALVMDLEQGLIYEASWEQAENYLQTYPRLLGDTRARDDGHFRVDVQVGDRFLELVVDTGAAQTTVYGLRESELPRDAVGMIDHRLRITAGEVVRAVAVQTRERLAQASAPEDGLLGLDVLDHCALALDPERLLARCTDEKFAAWQPMQRGKIVQLGGPDGPVLTPRAAGGFHYSGDNLDADIDRDGHVHIHRHWSRQASERTEREEREWLYDETRDARIEMSRVDSLRTSFEALPRLLAWVRNDAQWTMEERRELLFRIWDEAAEPDDAELGAAGAEARRIIDAFVRRELPRGSRDGFGDDELQRLNARRAGRVPFDPYRPPPDADRASP